MRANHASPLSTQGGAPGRKPIGKASYPQDSSPRCPLALWSQHLHPPDGTFPVRPWVQAVRKAASSLGEQLHGWETLNQQLWLSADRLMQVLSWMLQGANGRDAVSFYLQKPGNTEWERKHEEENAIATLENSFLRTNKHTPVITFTHPIPEYLFTRNKGKYMSTEDLYVNAHSSFICNNQKLETNQMSINRWMEKQIVVHSYNGIVFNKKKKWLSVHTTWLNPKIIM